MKSRHTATSARHDLAGRRRGLDTEFTRGLGLFDSTMVVVGSMIGSGIFIVSADMARLVGSPGWLLLAWVVTGVLTIPAALSYGELAAMMPRAGGQYVYLHEAFSPLVGFLYGWTLFMVIQTGTIAAVAVAFGRFLGVLWPAISESSYIIPPMHVSSGYALSLSTAQLVALLLDRRSSPGTTRAGSSTARSFRTSSRPRRPAPCSASSSWACSSAGTRARCSANFGDLWTPRGLVEIVPGLTATTDLRAVRRRVCVAQIGLAVLVRCLEQHHVHGRRGEGPAEEHPALAGAGHVIVITHLPARQRRLPRDPAARRDPERAVGPGRAPRR